MRDEWNWYSYCGNNPVIYVDLNGLEYGTIREFADGLDLIFGFGPYYEFTENNSVRIQVGDLYFKKVGEFYFDGRAVLYSHGGRKTNIEQVGTNVAGTLYMERTDFYEAMNINYVAVSQNVTVTNLENETQRFVMGAITAIATYNMNPAAGFVIGFVSGEFVSGLQLEPGDYRVEYILGEVYNGADNAYESVITTTYYKLGVDAEGNPNEQFVMTTTKYGGIFPESMVSE